jgi:hypothetical protein
VPVALAVDGGHLESGQGHDQEEQQQEPQHQEQPEGQQGEGGAQAPPRVLPPPPERLYVPPSPPEWTQQLQDLVGAMPPQYWEQVMREVSASEIMVFRC